MHENNLENKDLRILFLQVEIFPVPQSYQSIMMTNMGSKKL